jgi:acyl CoA:acetate/3-ketoacid CoA transferase beta subunit
VRCVDLLITELAVFEFRDGVAWLIELAPGVTVEEVVAKTEATFKIAEPLGSMAD